MIVDDDGTTWGTAAEIAAHLGHGVTAAAVRRWADRDHLPRAATTDDAGRRQVRYPLGEATRIELAKRHARRGRHRRCLTDS